MNSTASNKGLKVGLSEQLEHWRESKEKSCSCVFGGYVWCGKLAQSNLNSREVNHKEVPKETTDFMSVEHHLSPIYAKLRGIRALKVR